MDCDLLKRVLPSMRIENQIIKKIIKHVITSIGVHLQYVISPDVNTLNVLLTYQKGTIQNRKY